MACRGQARTAEIEAILVDKTKRSEVLRQIRPGDVHIALNFRFLPAHANFDVAIDKRGIFTDRLQRGRRDPFFRCARREVVRIRVLFQPILVPVAHHLIRATAVKTPTKPRR
jgi:hypothetical protein